MAAINPVQSSLHPHSLSGLSPPRVLMCSASVGSEGSVTLQLRDSTNSTDSTQSAASDTLDNALTIGYPDPEMLADVLGNLQTTCNSLKTSNNSTSSIGHNSNSSVNTCNSITVSKKLIVQETTQQPAETVTTSTSTTNRSNSKTCNTSSCLISRSSSTNIQLANVQAMNCSSAASLLSNSNNNPNSNSNSSSNSNSNSSSSSGISNFSSNNSNDSLHIAHKNSNSNGSISTSTSTSTSNNHKNVPGPNPSNILKKSRPKLSSPTRHGPQQCQVCSKVFGNASALAKHKLTHSDERKYVCAMCSKAFKRQDHLNGHMMTHRNKKPYECKADGCGKSYCDARSLRRHTENHHAAAAAASAAVAVAATPQNQTLSATTGTSLGLSLSPATASGDASSPDGATCIRTYITAAGSVVDAQTGVPLSDEQLKSITFNGGVTVLSPASSNSLSPSVSTASPISITEANLESEGLTRQQLDLISQIMQQTKQSSAQVTVSTSTNMNSYKIDAATTTSTATAQSTTVQQHQSANSVNRPRTWNMQTQLNSSQKVSITVDNITTASASMAAVDNRDFSLNQQLVAGINPQLLNIVKVDQKPVECNLCHRKFKNIPALNGHMRLHGGYFKKDPEAKKNEKKDTSGPPLQTASIGVRALIEEKIISKRRKDLNKSGAFAIPAPPSNVATNSIKRSASDLENFLSPKAQSNAAGGSLAAGQQLALPAVTTIRNSSLSIQQIGLPQSIDLVNTSQKPTNVSVGVGTSCNATVPPNPSTASSGMMHATTTKCSSTDPKDSTLIELLKRGTRVAVATKRTQHSTNNLITTTDISTAPHQIITNTGAVVIPSELQVLSTNAANHSTTRLHGSHSAAPVSISLAETTPLSLTISQTTGSSGDIYTLTYSTDSSAIFDEAEVYNVSDAEMLLQTVDSIQLLNDSSDERQSGHSDQFAPANTAINPVGGAGASSVASLADSLLDYQTYHSKELIMASSTNTSENAGHTQQLQGVRSNSLAQSSMPADTLLKQQAIAATAMLSPLHSPLAYPTPPASHENATQSSPFVDEAQHFVESANAFFNEKCSTDFLKDTADSDFFKNAPETTDRFAENDKILKLKNVLEDSDFDTAIKVEDLLSGSDDTECDLREFAEQNLSFLDDDQEFLDDSGNATSPLSESFFTSGIGTAEEVKEVLREVLPDEHMKGEGQSENVIDLYYLPGIGLQSQMMPNSEDPLLSSSPRDFGQQRAQQHLLQVQQQQLQQQQQLYTTHLQQKPQMHPQTLQTDLKSAQMHPTPTSFIQGSNNEFPILITTTATKTSPHIEYDDPGLSQRQHFTNSHSTTQYKNSDTDMQTVIYTGSTDKEEITINPQQSNLEIGPESTAQSVDDTSVYFNNNSTSLLTSHQLTHIAPTRVPTSVPVPFSVSNGSESVLLVTPVSQPGSILKRRLRSNDSGDPSKYHGLYRSKLRRPTRTHYTPAPTLNPDRKGLGLYCNIRQSLLPGSISFDAIDNDFDDPVGLVDFSDDSKVNLGSAYQAQLPPYEVPGNLDGFSSSASDELLWDPNIVPCVDSLKRFIELSKSGGPLGYHSEEEALQAVLQSQGNLQAAIVMLMNTQSTAFQMKWTANELERFLQSLERHGKNFATIAKELNTKSTGECVQMYYFWKKLNVDYKVTHLKVEKPVLPLVPPAELRPHVCEMPDCSASFTSKAALHGHTRIHCYGRSSNMPATSSISTASSGASAAPSSGTSQLTGQPSSKDDFPCKVCGKVFNKVKSRSAHMKTHRIQEGDVGAAVQQLQTHPQLQHQQQHQLQLQLQQPEAP